MENIREFIEKADLHYQGIGRIPEAGIPIGNGRMGSLVWMDEEELRLQWNRVDVFANDASSQSFPKMDTDYSSGTGMVDISFGTGADAVFGEETEQHLSVYDGRLKIVSGGVEIEIFLDMDRDVCYMHICDRREKPQKIRLSLRTVRGGSLYRAGIRPQVHPSLQKDKLYSYAGTGEHTAVSCLEKEEETVRLRQFFEEKEYFCQSLLEISSFGRKPQARIRNQSEAVLEWTVSGEDLWIRMETAQSFERETLKLRTKENMTVEKMEEAKAASEKWWHDFWERAPKMRLHSGDEKADMVSMHSVYFLYLMAVTSRGSYMPRYGGLLFYTAGDYRYWGAQYWWHNQSCYYAPLVKLGCHELADACFSHYWNSMESYRMAAKQQWGTRGIFIPETCWFSGPCRIPEELQDEMQKLYTLQKPWESRSEAFRSFAEGRNTYESRWNWEDPDSEDGTRGYGPYAYVTHIFSTTAKIAMLFWERYLESADRGWLEMRAYPVLFDTAEMYLHLPFWQEGEDGLLHIYHVNNHEDLWNARDTISELSAVHGILPAAARAAEILQRDEKKRAEWTAFEKRVTPVLTNESDGALLPEKEGEEKMWCCGAAPAQRSRPGYYHNMDPVNIFHLLTMETPEGEFRTTGENTYRKCLELHGFGTKKAEIGELDPFVLSVGKMGDKKAVEFFLPEIIANVNPENFIDREGTGYTVILDNRMTLREGVQAIGAQRLGQASESMACALCNGVPGAPGEEPVLHLFEGLPDGWDAEFELPGGNGYRVYAKREKGEIRCLKFESHGEKKLLVRNPWGKKEILVDYGERQERHREEKFQIFGSCHVHVLEQDETMLRNGGKND